jgi:hypothetical protein
VAAPATGDARLVTNEEYVERMRAFFAWKSKQFREYREAAREQAEVAALERMLSLQSPQRPRLTVYLVLTLAVELFVAFSILFEHVAVTLFPFHKLCGRPRKSRAERKA